MLCIEDIFLSFQLWLEYHGWRRAEWLKTAWPILPVQIGCFRGKWQIYYETRAYMQFKDGHQAPWPHATCTMTSRCKQFTVNARHDVSTQPQPKMHSAASILTTKDSMLGVSHKIYVDNGHPEDSKTTQWCIQVNKHIKPTKHSRCNKDNNKYCVPI